MSMCRAPNSTNLETPTWRANADWGSRLGYGADALDGVNRDAVSRLRSVGDEFPTVELIVSGLVGPRGDGYYPGELLMPDDAALYHRAQIESFVAAGADWVIMLTATHTGEAIGVVRARGNRRHPSGHRLHGGDRWSAPDRTASPRGQRRDRRCANPLRD
jgi:S-methylmethionine-dependent homocysteine/selenocysteine methylase